MIIPIFALLMSWSICAESEWQYLSFDDAMQKNAYPDAMAETYVFIGLEGNMLYDFFKNMYEENNFSLIPPGTELKIPKIIHQIWLGSPLPESFKALRQSWITQHMGRDWLYKLWTDEDVAQMELYNQEFYDATNNYGIKSDILRWEILYMNAYVD
jgi:mannosyltransferase OCH1-like enzyme